MNISKGVYSTTFNNRIYFPITLLLSGTKNHMVPARVLWDTGSNGSCISTEFIKKLDLLPIKKINHLILGNITEDNIYMINVKFNDSFFITNLEVSDGGISHPQVDILLGMDVINQGNFSIFYSDNQYLLSFEVK